MADEAQRQFYLAAAGVRLWYARHPLPGAAPSPEFRFPEEPADVVPAAPVAHVGDAVVAAQPEGRKGASARERGKGKGHIADLQSLMDGRSAANPARDEQLPAAGADETAVAVTSASPDKPVVPSIKLQTWSGTECLLIGVLSAQSSLALQQTLAENILKAIGELEARPSEILRWPLFNNTAVPLNQPVHLESFLKDWLPQGDHRWVIVLGDTGPWLDDALVRRPDIRMANSLASLAGDPDSKRALWQELKRHRDQGL